MTLKNIYLDQFIKVVERAAYGASKFRGKNDKISADQAAVDEMRTEINKINIKVKGSGFKLIGTNISNKSLELDLKKLKRKLKMQKILLENICGQ